MTKTEFDAALVSLFSGPEAVAPFLSDLRARGLRIVPDVPVAWRTPTGPFVYIHAGQVPAGIYRTPLFADPEDSEG